MPQSNRTSISVLNENNLARLKYANARVKSYTREGQVDPDVRKFQKSYYRGDQKMKPIDPSVSNPGDQQLRDLYEGSGKYHGYGTAALGGMNGAYPNQGRISAAMQVKNTKPGK